MKMKLFSRGAKGFTLVELLVVIAIIALLVAIVFPAISDALLKGRVTAVSINGQNIYKAIIGAQTSDIYLSTASPFPDRNSDDRDFNNTREYFEFLVTSGVMNVGWSFFAAPGVPSTSERSAFVSNDRFNAWRIVDGGENIPETVPFLWTRNLEIDNLTQGHEMLVDTVFGSLHPFQNRGFAFVTRGGAAYALSAGQLNDQSLKELFVVRDARDNVIDRTVLPH